MMGVTKRTVRGTTPPLQHHPHDQLVDAREVLLLFHPLINLGPVNADPFPIYSLSDNTNSLRVRAVKEGGDCGHGRERPNWRCVYESTSEW